MTKEAELGLKMLGNRNKIEVTDQESTFLQVF